MLCAKSIFACGTASLLKQIGQKSIFLKEESDGF